MSQTIQAIPTPGSKQDERVLILDYGGPYKQIVGRKVRDLHVYCEIRPASTPGSDIAAGKYHAIILSGGDQSVNDPDAPTADPELLSLGLPVLGIGYGAHWLTKTLGGQVTASERAEAGLETLTYDRSGAIFSGLPTDGEVWVSQTNEITVLPAGVRALQAGGSGASGSSATAAFTNEDQTIIGLQFHPEMAQTEHGSDMLANFLFRIAGLKGSWIVDRFIEESVEGIREAVGQGRVLSGFSGGVDSSVASLLVHQAVGEQLTCIFVDHGLLRQDEGDQVMEVFANEFKMHIIRVDARERFYTRLDGVTDPEAKRKIIGEEFIRVFEEEAAKLGEVDDLVQGTIYPDIMESGVDGAMIKSHHNVGGLPADIGFKGLIEPLRDLFKDEVREVGEQLGIPEALVWRQPFPGPGLAVRIIGAITAERVQILQRADAIFREEIARASLHRDYSQYFAVLTDMRSVGVKRNARSYDYTVGLRAVITNDFMTASWARIPYDLLALVSERIVDEVDGVNRVVYDITGKPPATIEWE